MSNALELARFNMIEQQIRPWDVSNSRVLDTLTAIPREQFTPKGYKDFALMDIEVPLSREEFMMHPRVEGRFLQALDIQPEDDTFEVGTGSGYLTACMASLGKHAYSVELHPELCEMAAINLKACGIKNATLWQGNAVDGWKDAPHTYDAIAVTGSFPTYNDAFEKMLNVGGRLVMVVGTPPIMTTWLITKTDATNYTRKQLFETNLKALTHAISPSPFKW